MYNRKYGKYKEKYENLKNKCKIVIDMIKGKKYYIKYNNNTTIEKLKKEIKILTNINPLYQRIIYYDNIVSNLDLLVKNLPQKLYLIKLINI
jgi:hypothetical protein